MAGISISPASGGDELSKMLALREVLTDPVYGKRMAELKAQEDASKAAAARLIGAQDVVRAMAAADATAVRADSLLTTARAEAADTVARAEATAQRLISDAKSTAALVRSEAEKFLLEAQRTRQDADAVLATARDAAARSAREHSQRLDDLERRERAAREATSAAEVATAEAAAVRAEFEEKLARSRDLWGG